MQSLTTLPGNHNVPRGDADQARSNEALEQSATPSPEPSIQSLRHRGAGVLALGVLALFAAGLVYGGTFERLRGALSGPLEAYFLNAGIVLEKIHIRGQVNLDDAQIITRLGISPGQSLVGFDAGKAQKQLTALGPVKTARVMRLLPSTLLVEIEERLPFARWLRDGHVDLVDHHGIVLGALAGVEPSHYPLVAGNGAARPAGQLIRLLSAHEALAGRIKMAERVAQFRWNLHAKSGAMIKLPSKDLALALARLVALPEWQDLLANKKIIVDLRHRGQAFVREREQSTQPSMFRS